jgi:hypothetical protein
MRLDGVSLPLAAPVYGVPNHVSKQGELPGANELCCRPLRGLACDTKHQGVFCSAQ